MQFLKTLVAVFSATCCSAFFEIFKSAPTSNAQQPAAYENAVRGVPEYLHGKYLSDVFVCDGNVRLSRSDINNNYCDCDDMSDEPGTSACLSSTFQCINKGYKMVMIPSSRVDDAICDCCDGSDEAVGSCPNTCNQAAERERAAMESLTSAYKLGSVIRNSLIANVKLEKTKLSDSLGPVTMDIARIENEISVLRSQKDAATEKANQDNQEALSAVSAKVNNLLGVSNVGEQLTQLLSALLSTLDLEQHHVDKLLPSELLAETDVTHTASDDAIGTVEEDLYTEPDGYGTSDSEISLDAPSCGLVEQTADARLSSLCRASDPSAAAATLLHDVVKEHSAHSVFMLLTGFFRLHNTFSGSADFARENIALSADSCPAAFSDIKEHCSLTAQLADSFAEFKEVTGRVSSEVTALQSQIEALERNLNELAVEKRNAEDAVSDLEKHADHLEFLALKDQCFDVVDGKFSYSLCVLGRISQKEVDGHNTVTLGEFSSLETRHKDSSVLMHFDNGQYCHAHGARKADVTVVCGPEHVLKSATEPSTCFYNLVFESPAACTPQFALLNGIEV